MAVLGFCCCVGISLDAESQGYSLVAECRLLIEVASLGQASLGQASPCGGFSRAGFSLRWRTGSRARRLP